MPKYEFIVVKRINTPTRKLLRKCIPKLDTLLEQTCRYVTRLLYDSPSDTPTNFHTVRLVVRSMPGGVAYTTDAPSHSKEIHFSVEYFEGVYKNANRNLRRLRDEIRGVLVHEMVHVLQYSGKNTAPGWFIEGLADFIRLRAELSPPHWFKRRGGSWTDSYSTAAYFLDWVDTTVKPGFLKQMNVSLASNEWQNDIFQRFTSRSIDGLWNEYQESIQQ